MAKILLQQTRNLSDLFQQRVKQTPENIAYRFFATEQQAWQDITWQRMAEHVARWQASLKQENLAPGSRVGILLRNCPQWVMFEQAALGLGLVVIPFYPNDRPENIAYIIQDAEVKILLLDGGLAWASLKGVCAQSTILQRIVSITPIADSNETRLTTLATWLPSDKQNYPLAQLAVDKSSLATIVYTSGTTGKPKGVMLSHGNILWCADSGSSSIDMSSSDTFLSFLPLSHMFERSAGYYIPMLCGATVAYARSIELLAEDLITIRPTILITVPRIFERVYNKIKLQLAEKPAFARKLFHSAVTVGWYRFRFKQGKAPWHPRLLLWPILNLLVARKIMAKLGGRLRLAVSGGAPLSAEIGKTFIALGLPISQGYGMTEASPVVSTNRLDDNEPAGVGQPLRDVEVKLGNNDELCVRSPGVMLGYWNNEKATKEVIDADHWLHTGDKARLDKGHIYITGRIKEILVLSNGEKLPPADLEMAIASDPIFEQALIVGEAKPYLSAITVLNPKQWQTLAATLKVEPTVENLNIKPVQDVILERIRMQMQHFPGYAKIFCVHNTLEPWTVENSLMTPTLKIRRNQIIEKFAEQIEHMYAGH